jgi:hypothetical protein
MGRAARETVLDSFDQSRNATRLLAFFHGASGAAEPAC